MTARDLLLLGIAGALTGFLIKHWLTNTRDKIARRATASAKFNSEVLNILSGLYPLASDWPKNIYEIDTILRSAFPKMQIAVEDFKYSLPWHKKPFFNHTWSRFRNAYGRDQDIQCYHNYMPGISTSIVNGKEATIDTTKTYKETFKHNVAALLKFANKI
jgi:hypothetical protein